MKFYDGEDLNAIIKNYEKKSDTLYKVYNLNEEYYFVNNEEYIKEKMIEQANKRDKELLDRMETKVKINILEYISSFIPMILATKIELGILFYTAFIYSLISLFQLSINNIKLKDLKKYHIYLEIKEELEQCNEKELIKYIENDPYYKNDININTLDEFDLNDMKIIKKELKRRKK